MKGQFRKFPPFYRLLVNQSSRDRLAMTGVLAIIHSIAVRCGDRIKPALPDAEEGETSDLLKEKKDHKRRIELAVAAFNSSPTKCHSKLQRLGFLPSTVTPQSMADFIM